MLTTIVAEAVQLSGTEAGAIYAFDESRQEYRLRATHGMDEEMIAAIRDRRIARVRRNRQGSGGTDTGPDSGYIKESSLILDVVVRAGYRAVLIVPLFAPNESSARWWSAARHRRIPQEHGRASADLRRQSVLAIQNARLFREIEDKEPAARRGEPAQVAVPRQHEP